MLNKIKAGIIGFGYMGNFHLNRTREVGKIEVIAVYDIDEQKLLDAREENLLSYNNLEDFLSNEEISLVIICTPNDVHKELSIKSLNAGKNVICEKPAMLNLLDLNEVLECAHKNDKFFTTHQNRRWDNDYRVVKEILASGKIGQVTTIFSQTFGQRGVCFGWRADESKGGGMLYDWGIHLIDQLLMMFQEKKVISVYARLRSILTPIVDDYFEVELEFEDDIVAHISVGTFCLQERPRWFILGDKGTVRIDDFSGLKGGISKINDNVRGFKRVKGNTALGPSRTMAHLEKENIEMIELPKVESENLEFYNNIVSVMNGENTLYVTEMQMIRDMQVIEAVFKANELKQKIEVSI